MPARPATAPAAPVSFPRAAGVAGRVSRDAEGGATARNAWASIPGNTAGQSSEPAPAGWLRLRGRPVPERPHLDAPEARHRMQAGDLDRLVLGLALDDVVPGDHLFRLGERA